jgi:hypothetical protein
MKVELHDALEFGTDRPVRVGRIEETNGRITLALRYLDEKYSVWHPTWVGPAGGAVQVPPGWVISFEMAQALDAAESS